MQASWESIAYRVAKWDHFGSTFHSRDAHSLLLVLDWSTHCSLACGREPNMPPTLMSTLIFFDVLLQNIIFDAVFSLILAKLKIELGLAR